MAVILIDILAIKNAQKNIEEIVIRSPFTKNVNYSSKFKANIFFKREDLQEVKSFKIRGAFNKISSLNSKITQNDLVCASAGNHAQGVALSCKKLNLFGTIFMPIQTPNQKVSQVKKIGKDNIKVVLIGDSYDEAHDAAISFCKSNHQTYIHPFDDIDVITGQGTLFLEIIQQAPRELDYLFVPIGGGGLISGAISVFKQLSPNTKIIGIETMGAPAMKNSLENGKNITLDSIDTFVDGASVKRVGEISFKFCKEYLDDIILINEGEICHTLIDLYNNEHIEVELAGAMSVSALNKYSNEIIGKNVACIICGANNDKRRMPEIKKKANLWRKSKK
ncbi:MAG: threonine ammonia-lyase IlvA [Flavobacteriales bacterium]|jgi:threonine dehydratase|tara:strand:- start:17004 stop:18008 length:1005 start_codon:yes stop_codon:yes gene_type:complete